MRLILIIAFCLSCSPSVNLAKQARDVIELLKANVNKQTDEIKNRIEFHRADKERLITGIVEFSVIASDCCSSSAKFFDAGFALPNNKSIEIFRDQKYLDSAKSGYIAKISEENIDLKLSQLVLLNMGTQVSDGHAITAESVVDYGDHVKLHVLSSELGYGCVINLWLTHPFQLLKINSRKKLIVQERYERKPCAKKIESINQNEKR